MYTVDMTTKKIITAVLAGALAALVYTGGQWLSDTRHDSHLTTCRDGARHVMQEVLADRMTPEQATERLDGHCEGVTPAERKTIVDTERSVAIAREMTD